MKVNQLLFALLLCSLFSYAQQPYYNQRPEFLKANSVWAFGKNAGLDFNGGTPTAIHTELFSEEGCASVADPITGKLLFYSNGGQVWDANHRIMPNGYDLLGNPLTYFPSTGPYSTAQGVCIVPVIGTSDQYYLFSLSGITSGSRTSYGSLFYNVVDMKLNNGIGDVDSSKKNIPLNKEDFLSEGMIAVPGNNCDIWLMLHRYLPTKEEFMAYHITQDGIDTVPVISPSLTVGPRRQRTVSTMAISPDRQKIAITCGNAAYGILIGQFDPNTGQVNNVLSIGYAENDTNNFHSYGVCFSPDNSKLYIGAAKLWNSSQSMNHIYQYDLSRYDSNAISSSMQIVGSIMSQPFGMMKQYDDIIYNISLRGGEKNTYIHRINKPNLSGIACDFQINAIPLVPRDSSMSGLPNDVVFPLSHDTITALTLDTIICPNDHLVLKPKIDYQQQYIWNDDTTASDRIIDKPGVYWIVQTDGCQSYVDTFIVNVFDFPRPVINVNMLDLGIAGSFNYDHYQWLLNGNPISGATERNYTVSGNGDYRVVVKNEAGCTDTSDIYKVTNADEAAIPGVRAVAPQINFYPNPTDDIIYIQSPIAVDVSIFSIEGTLLTDVSDAKEVSLKDFANGLYLMRIYDKDGNLMKVVKGVKR